MTNETRQRLRDALDSCRAIRRYTAGVDFTTYLSNDMLRDAVERRLGIVGEALNRAQAADPALAGQIRELRRIVGMRNRVVHGYDTVDNEIVWTVVQKNVPLLETRLAHLLAEEAPHDDPCSTPPGA